MNWRRQLSGFERDRREGQGGNRMELLPQVLQRGWFCPLKTSSSIFVISLEDSLAGG